MRRKNTTFIAIRCVLSSSKCTKTRYRPGSGSAADPVCGAYVGRFPRSPSRLGRGHLSFSPYSSPLSTSSAFRSRLGADGVSVIRHHTAAI